MTQVLITPEQAAEALSLGRTSVYDLIGSGQLRSVKIGRRRRVPVEALDEYVAGLDDGSAATQPAGDAPPA